MPALMIVGALFYAVAATDADGKKPAGPEPSPRIVAAGTATWKLGKVQDNSTSVRVQLKDEIALRLGDDYIVILTSRYSGYL
jgi:hypothetical protein